MSIRNERGELIVLEPLLIGSSVSLFFLRAFVDHSGPLSQVIGNAAFLCLIAGVVAGLAMAAAVVVARSFGSHRGSMPVATIHGRMGLIVAAVMLPIVGCAFALPNPGFVPAIIVGGLFCGIGIALHLALWGAIYSTFVPQTILLNASVSYLMASIAQGAFLASPLALSGADGISVLVVADAAAGLCMAAELRRGASSRFRDGEAVSDAPASTHASDLPRGILARASFATLAKVLWKPLAGAMIVAFILGLIWNPAPAGEGSGSEAGTLWGAVSGPLLAVGVIVLLLRRSPREFTLHSMQSVLLPASVTVLMVMPFFDTGDPRVMVVTRVLTTLSFAIVGIVIWTTCAASARTSDLSAVVVMPVAFAIMAACFAAGIVLIWQIGEGGKLLCLAVTAVYLIVTNVAMAFEGDTRTPREIEKDAAARYLEERTRLVVDRFGLTGREAEVLGYLCRGFSQVYIARELYISENTVRTHAKHIYAKTGVHSREELLELLNG